MSSIEVFAVHSPVTLGNGLEGKVTCISIRDAALISYEVGFWVENEWKQIYLPASEVKQNKNSKTVRIGFHNQR